MPIPAEYAEEHKQHKAMRRRREITGLHIVQAVVDGDMDLAAQLAERWKEEDAECDRLYVAEQAGMLRHKAMKAARKAGMVAVRAEDAQR